MSRIIIRCLLIRSCRRSNISRSGSVGVGSDSGGRVCFA